MWENRLGKYRSKVAKSASLKVTGTRVRASLLYLLVHYLLVTQNDRDPVRSIVVTFV